MDSKGDTLLDDDQRISKRGAGAGLNGQRRYSVHTGRVVVAKPLSSARSNDGRFRFLFIALLVLVIGVLALLGDVLLHRLFGP